MKIAGGGEIADFSLGSTKKDSNFRLQIKVAARLQSGQSSFSEPGEIEFIRPI
jgi:hypothetical protein